WRESAALVLRRGPYVVAAGLDERAPNAAPIVLGGPFIDLFSADLPIVSNVTLPPGRRALLRLLPGVPRDRPSVLAAACRVTNERVEAGALRFDASGIGGTSAVVRVAAPAAPTAVLVGGKPLPRTAWDYEGGTARLRFPNSVDPQPVEVRFSR
ncbi:MAG TPA: hypothetical protein VKT77_18890, partial [Chthonomonadaceae bacterium]|nr:hypothetical protein [Chthonomonadaceae bacterium]